MTLPEKIEEKNIAIVMTDIIGSTKYVEKYGAGRAVKTFSGNDRITMNLILKFSGNWVDSSDGVLCYFYTVSDAISFAFEYKRAIKKMKLPFEVRIGIHWDKMLVTQTNGYLVKYGVKKTNIEGLGKNICARTMSICKSDQILMTHKAYTSFNSRIKNSEHIPKEAMCVLVGLYKFKGVKQPEAIYAIGTEESHLQPPPNSEKCKRLGGKRKIKTKLRQKRLKELISYFFWRIGFLYLILMIYYNWNILRYFKTIDNIHFIILNLIDFVTVIIKLYN